jgi:hypothetical protein
MELARALCSICQQSGCNDFILDSKVTKSTGLSCIVTYGVKNQHVSGMQWPLIKYVLFTGDITNSESEWIIHIRLCHNDGSHFQHAWTRCSYAGSSPLLCTLWTCTLLFFADTFSVLKLWAVWLLNRSKLLVPLGSICLQKFFRTIAWCGHSDHLWMKQWWIKLLLGSGHSTLAFILIPLPSCLSLSPPNNDFALTCYMCLSFSLMLYLANGSIVDHQAGSVVCWFMDFESQPHLNSRGCAKTK